MYHESMPESWGFSASDTGVSGSSRRDDCASRFEEHVLRQREPYDPGHQVARSSTVGPRQVSIQLLLTSEF